MARTAVAHFRDRPAADRAYEALLRQGFSADDISVIGRGAEREAGLHDAHHVSAGEGAAVGGVTGLLLGVAAMLIPGIGPIVAVGPITAALTGAVTGGVTGAVVGGLTGALIKAGVSEEEARYYDERFREGGVLLTVRTDDQHFQAAHTLLRQHGGDVGSPAAGSAAAESWDEALPRYRARWEQQYAARGGDWTEFEPAYRYGWQMRQDPRYRGRPWAEAEPELRRDWETRHRDRPWDRIAGAIRDTWEDATGDGRRHLELQEEQLVPRKEMREIGEVRIRKEVEAVPGRLEAERVREQVRVQHVPVNQVVHERVEPWTEGDGVYVVPVYEEQLVLVKQLVLKEHLRIERVRTAETGVFEDTVRREQVVIDDPTHRSVVHEQAPAAGPRASEVGRRR